ncbi:MAG: recombinase family protein [Faecousia sp.]
MRVWLYYRLSRDEDEELNSLRNQRSIIESYALRNGHSIVGESFDDNVSGMHFDREGIEQLCETVDAGLIDAVIVKDLSRLGRHRTQTALFIDYLRQNNVRVLSATENIDTFNEADDLVIGFKGLMNDFYARDGSRRVTTGYRQKQKAGIVITPPFGYFKDKNTNQVEIVSEAAETIHLIFAYYVSGMGVKAIARMLNEQKRKTPAQMQMELLGKRMPERLETEIKKKYLWDGTMVSRILRDEAYTGTLICHKSERNKINKTFRFTEAAEQFRHENYLPPIITKELWEQVQALMEMRKKDNVRAGEGQAIHRYSGLIVCGDCGRAFTAKTIKSKSGIRTEYWCSTYLRYGKEYCGSHALREEYLDEIIKSELLSTKEQYQQMWDAMQDSINRWTPKATNTLSQLKKLRETVETLEEEMEDILMERIRDKANAERYDRMIQKREEQIAQAKKKIAELENLGQTIRSRQAKLKKDISLIDQILADGCMTEAHLRLLIEKIYVSETEDGLSLDIRVKAPFQNHTDTYENGVLTNRELEEIIKAG